MTDICEIPGCNRTVKSRNRCLKHYKQKYYVRGEQDRLYDIWRQMLLRCYDKNNPGYINYGARGITVCPRWLVGLPNIKPHKLFINDMGPRSADDLSLERKDNDGNYEPDNCKWATKLEQSRNTRANSLITYQGETRCLAEWAEKLEIPRTRIADRLRLGWTVEEALTLPKQMNKYI